MRNIELNLWWEAREPEQAGDAEKLARFVSGLPSFDPIYRSWLRSPETMAEVLPVPLDETRARQALLDNIGRFDVGGVWPEVGSHIRAGHAGPSPYDFRSSSYADTTCDVGSFGRHAPRAPNHIFMRLSQLRPSTGRPWRASELRPLMRFAREIWSPSDMCALFPFYDLYLPEIPDPTWAAGKRTLKPWIGWITYLPPDLAARAKYPGDVEVESLPDGGALVTLCEEPFEETNVEGTARLQALQRALRPIQS